MSFCCADLVEMFSLTDTPITVIAGHAYLHREIQWVYLAEAVDDFLDTIPWTKGDELVIVTGSSIKGDADTALINYLRRSKKKNIAGLVINIGKYIDEISPRVIAVAESCQIPLMALPWESHLVDFTRQVCTAIIHQQQKTSAERTLASGLLLGQPPLSEIQPLLSRYGWEPGANYTVVGFALTSAQPERVQTIIREVYTILIQHNIQAATLPTEKKLYIVIRSDLSEDRIKSLFESVANQLMQSCAETAVQIAVGKRVAGITEVPQSLKTVQQILQACHFTSEKAVCSCHDLGIFSLLFSIDNIDILWDYYNQLFTPLLKYDKNNNSFLMNTLIVYMENEARVAPAAKALYIHENTLKYRLNIIRKLLQMDISLPEAQARIVVGIKIGNMLKRKEKAR